MQVDLRARYNIRRTWHRFHVETIEWDAELDQAVLERDFVKAVESYLLLVRALERWEVVHAWPGWAD